MNFADNIIIKTNVSSLGHSFVKSITHSDKHLTITFKDFHPRNLTVKDFPKERYTNQITITPNKQFKEGCTVSFERVEDKNTLVVSKEEYSSLMVINSIMRTYYIYSQKKA